MQSTKSDTGELISEFPGTKILQTGIRASLALAWIAIAIGLAGAAGWLFDLQILKTGFFGFADMKFNTAVCIVLSGASLILKNIPPSRRQSPVSSLTAFVSLLIAGATLFEYITQIDLGIDLLFFSDTGHPQFGLVPGRMSIITALVLFLMTAAILMRNRFSKTAKIWQLVALINLFLSFMVALSYVYAAGSIAYIYPFTGMALPTTVALILLNFGLLFSDPRTGIIAEFFMPYAGGRMARRLLPVSISILVLLGLLTRLGGYFGLFDRSADAVIIVTFGSALLTWLILQRAGAQNRLEQNLLKQQTALKKLHAELENKVQERTQELELQKEALQLSEKRYRDVIELANDAVFETGTDGKYIDVNPAACAMLGYSREELIGRAAADLVAEEDREKLLNALRELKLSGNSHAIAEFRVKRKDGSILSTEVSVKMLPDGRRISFLRDLSFRKKADAAVAISERKYRLLVEGAYDSILVADADGKIILINEQLGKKFGYASEELVGKPVEVLIPQRFHSRHVVDRKGFGRDPSARPMGARLNIYGIKKDGSEFPVDISLSPTHTQDGLQITAIIRDITERKRYEDQQTFLAQIAKSLNEVLEYEARAQLLADAMIKKFADNCVIRVFEDGVLRPKGIATRDSSKREILNKAMAEGAGISGNYGALEVAESRQTVLVEDPAESLLNNEQVDPKIKEITKTMRVTSYVTAPLISMNRVVGTLSVSMSDSGRKFSADDITFIEIVANRSAVAIENALLNRQAQIAKLVADNIPSMISYWDKDQRCRFANRVFFEWLGFSPEQMSGRTLQEVLGRGIYKNILPHVKGALKGQAQLFELDLTKLATGQLRHTQITYIPEVVAGEAQGFFALNTDVTELKRIQLIALSEKERAEAAVKLREEVLGIVSHDLHNPLAVINMAAYLLTEIKPPNASVQQYAARIQTSAKAMQTLIGDLLDFGKIEGGALTVNRAPVDVASAVNEALDAMQARASAKEVHLEVKIPECPAVHADKSRLIQVLWNLIGNAIKFTPQGGKVSVAAFTEDGVVRFSITDTGPGIPPENIAKVFDRFWQAEKTASLGAGLGLAIAKGIVAAHGGRIWAKSVPGKGAEFNFTIPVSSKRAVQETQRNTSVQNREAEQTLKGVRLLIVDDVAENLLLLRLFLEKAGALVTEARSVSEALTKISSKKPDVLITDIEMPGGSGYDLIEKIKSANGNGGHIPVAALSAHTSKKELKKMAEAGFDACLAKPVSQKKLVESISELVQRTHH